MWCLRSLSCSSSVTPPSGLPAISPTGGEIGSFGAAPDLPLEGEMAGRPEGGAVER
ncbi:propionyl-coenzyme A carboxylase alpha polypeptide [Aquibium carbonis]|uniref:Propionyl-coenzyme A carboxylase alpha polypeptide n=1 Tax=Aquibium carbonis TaxID=2495581 RepID=A0A429YYH6_9HYPH|nr:propionyl-coenzyme A carboxylase alpha polypeptide [Aquibium carbonis]